MRRSARSARVFRDPSSDVDSLESITANFFTGRPAGGDFVEPERCTSGGLGGFRLHGQLLVTVKAGASCTAGVPLWLMGTLTWKSLRVLLPAASRTRSVTV